LDPKLRNQPFIDHWLSQTLERLMASEGDKYNCETCPLLRDLAGADSQGNPFLGMLVSTCDFRGKRISADPELGDLAEEAYAEHDPDEMLDYADRLERRLEGLRSDGMLSKGPYFQYKRDRRNDPFAEAMGEPLLSREDYARQLHWRERNIRNAVHWLRTCAGYGVRMGTSY